MPHIWGWKVEGQTKAKAFPSKTRKHQKSNNLLTLLQEPKGISEKPKSNISRAVILGAISHE